MTRQVTFWQNMPSHHMAPVQRELARVAGYHVRVIFAEGVSAYRKGMGWPMPDFGQAECIILDQDPIKAKKLARQSKDINFLGGFPVGLFRDIFDNLPYSGAGTKRGLILEAGDTHDLKGKLRPVVHAIRTRQVRHRTDLVLAFGSRGVSYYTRCGFDPRIVYPFLYQNEAAYQPAPAPTENPVRIIFVGALVARKGADLLLRALSRLDGFPWVLEIVGDGPQERELKALAVHLRLGDRIKWRGWLSSSEVPIRLHDSDVCVVPSRNDGWGMLVSEALNAGLAVVTTACVGAKDLVRQSGAGCVTESLSISELTRCLESLLSSPEKIDAAKIAATRARPKLGGEPAARYLNSVIEQQFERGGEQPPPPWKD